MLIGNMKIHTQQVKFSVSPKLQQTELVNDRNIYLLWYKIETAVVSLGWVQKVL